MRVRDFLAGSKLPLPPALELVVVLTREKCGRTVSLCLCLCLCLGLSACLPAWLSAWLPVTCSGMRHPSLRRAARQTPPSRAQLPPVPCEQLIRPL